jgi:hypothetical protein
MKGGRMRPRQHEIASIKRCLGLNCPVCLFGSGRTGSDTYSIGRRPWRAEVDLVVEGAGRKNGYIDRVVQESGDRFVYPAEPMVDRSAPTKFLNGRFWRKGAAVLVRPVGHISRSSPPRRTFYVRRCPGLYHGRRTSSRRWRGRCKHGARRVHRP